MDFYQGDDKRLAVPAGRAVVYLDGTACPWLEVVEVVRGGWRQFGWATLAYNRAAYPEGEELVAEEAAARVGMGSRINIKQFYNGTYPGSAAFGLTIFAGQVEGIDTVVSPKEEGVRITARDYACVLDRLTVYGRRVKDIDGIVVFLSGAGTVFNEDGEPNASAGWIEHNGRNVRVFSASRLQARAWTCADAIDYLLCEYLPAGELARPGVEQLRALTGDVQVRDLDVTGVSLLEALHRCCEGTGVEFKFVPRLSETGPEQAIVFYRPGYGRMVELNLQQRGQRVSVSKTNVWKAESRRNLWPVTTKYVGQGDYKVFEGTFNLVKAWDASLESWDYEEFSPSTNPDFHRVRDIYRKWCLNEAGDYSGPPYNQGPAYDFSRIFGTDEFVHHRRRFWPALTSDLQGRSLGYVLEISYNDGVNWWPYSFAFNNLLDECGIWLASDKLDQYVWVAALKGVLRFRITASVVSDERIGAVAANGAVGATSPVVERVVTMPRQFKFRQVSSASSYANPDGALFGRPDEVDDGAALYDYVRRAAEADAAAVERIDVQTPFPGMDFEVGDGVTSSPESWDIFSVRSDNRSSCWIERVRLDFHQQCTEIAAVRKRRCAL